MNRSLVLFLVVPLIIPSLAVAQDEPEFDLRGRGPTPGLKMRTRSKGETKGMEVTIKVEGKLITTIKMDQTVVKDSEITVDAVKDRTMTQFTTRILKDETTSTSTPGDKKPKVTTGALTGQSVVSKKTEAGWSHALASGKPTKEQEAALAVLPTPDDDELIPMGKQKIGATWDVDAAQVKSLQTSGLISPMGKVTGKFTGVQQLNGHLCSTIDWSGTVKAKMKIEDTTVDASIEVKQTEYRSLAYGITMKADGTVSIKATGPIKLGQTPAEMELKANSKEVRTVELAE